MFSHIAIQLEKLRSSPDTSPDSACEDLMIALEQCHAKGFLWKSIGMCNDPKDQLAACLRSERYKTQSSNRNGVADKKSKIREKWREIDENS
jgi:COX assembly protein 2